MADLPVADEAAWHQLRRVNIGGSEAAGLFSWWAPEGGEAQALHGWEDPPPGFLPVGAMSPYHDPHTLWLAKRGVVAPEFDASNERIQAGTFLEPAIAEWSKARWGWPIQKVRRYTVHDDVPGWGASADYELKEPGLPVVEIKNVDFIVARDKWVIEDDTVVAVPMQIQLQIQHMLGARKSSHAWIVACVGGNTLVRGRVERHEPTIARIGVAITAFWEAVRTGTHPRSGLSRDGVVAEFRVGEKTNPPIDLRADNELPTLAEKYLAWKKREDEAKLVREQVGASIQLKLGKASAAFYAGGKISWPAIERAEQTIVQKALVYRGGLTVSPQKAK